MCVAFVDAQHYFTQHSADSIWFRHIDHPFVQVLSSMQLSAQSAVHRCSVTAASGEEMILSIAMCREERHKPSYRLPFSPVQSR